METGKYILVPMSGHSKWSTIKHQKGINDARRGQLFSKLARAITIAAKVGGGNPDSNLKLRLAMDKAREANMPKENVERAVEKGKGAAGGTLQEVVYEGYGPGGVAILVEAATDNRNRTTQEIKSIFDKAEGSLGSPGSVSFQFEQKGLILVDSVNDKDKEEKTLKIIDIDGVDDVLEIKEGIEVYTSHSNLMKVKEEIEALGISVKSAELTFKPKTPLEVEEKKLDRIIKLINTLDEHDDTQKVYANLA